MMHMFQGRIHLTRGENYGVSTLFAKENNSGRFNIVLNDIDLPMEGSEYWMSFPARLVQQTRRILLKTINCCLRNRDWQERNRIYVEPTYIILTAL
ncbi:hypothetical protein PUN28_000873 [Cardiocondyla obscurior]|uniref:Uncharacterized protein n=1 Tax=Cardiocondyla obscurior TaxID=286306 RepID=A0AAW2H1I8_9HYME